MKEKKMKGGKKVGMGMVDKNCPPPGKKMPKGMPMKKGMM